jgi:hypothetical protein
MYLLDKMDQPGFLWMAKVVDSRRDANQVSIAAEMTKRIGEARAFHEVLRNFSAKEITWAIYGDREDTCVGVDFTFDRRAHESFEQIEIFKDRPGMDERSLEQGDNTVPVASARGESLTTPDRRKAVYDIGHSDACTDSDLIDVVKDILRDVLGTV